MIYQNFSKRQLLTLTWWNKPQFMDCDGIICDGSIRSGKTVSMTDGFILWSMSRFNGQSFAICGKTIESLRRNVITLMPQWLEGIFSITERRSENKLIITSGAHADLRLLRQRALRAVPDLPHGAHSRARSASMTEATLPSALGAASRKS